MLEDGEALIIDPERSGPGGSDRFQHLPTGLNLGMSLLINIVLCAGSVGATYAFMRGDINTATARLTAVEQQLQNIHSISEKLAVIGSKVDDMRIDIQQLRGVKDGPR